MNSDFSTAKWPPSALLEASESLGNRPPHETAQNFAGRNAHEANPVHGYTASNFKASPNSFEVSNAAENPFSPPPLSGFMNSSLISRGAYAGQSYDNATGARPNAYSDAQDVDQTKNHIGKYQGLTLEAINAELARTIKGLQVRAGPMFCRFR